MKYCLRTTPSSRSAMMWNNIAQEVMLGTPTAWKEHNSFNTCPNGASDEFIGIYAKNRCHWSNFLIESKPRLGRYACLKLQGP